MGSFFRNWLTRPGTTADAASALSQAGHAQYRARVAATAEQLQREVAANTISRIAPRAQVVAGYGRRSARA